MTRTKVEITYTIYNFTEYRSVRGYLSTPHKTYVLCGVVLMQPMYLELWSFRLWLVVYTAPSHYMDQCWRQANSEAIIWINWTLGNTLQWNFNKITNFSFTKMHLTISEYILLSKILLIYLQALSKYEGPEAKRFTLWNWMAIIQQNELLSYVAMLRQPDQTLLIKYEKNNQYISWNLSLNNKLSLIPGCPRNEISYKRTCIRKNDKPPLSVTQHVFGIFPWINTTNMEAVSRCTAIPNTPPDSTSNVWSQT